MRSSGESNNTLYICAVCKKEVENPHLILGKVAICKNAECIDTAAKHIKKKYVV